MSTSKVFVLGVVFLVPAVFGLVACGGGSSLAGSKGGSTAATSSASERKSVTAVSGVDEGGEVMAGSATKGESVEFDEGNLRITFRGGDADGAIYVIEHRDDPGENKTVNIKSGITLTVGEYRVKFSIEGETAFFDITK